MPYKFNPFTGNFDLIDVTAAAGSDTQVQYNDGGSLAGSADLTWDDTGKELGVGGDINLTGNISVSLGSNTSPSVYFGTDVNSGLYSPGADQVAISTNGTERLAIDGNGKVIAGNITADTPNSHVSINSGILDVALRVMSGSNNDTTILRVSGAQAANGFTVGTYSSDTTNDGGVRLAASKSFAFDTNGSERLRIDSSGKVGIGTTSPGTYNANLAVYSAGGGFSSVLHSNVSGSFPKASAIALGSDAVAYTYSTNGGTVALTGSAHIAAIQSASSGASTDIAFINTSSGSVSEKARIDSDGRLLVGTSSVPAPATDYRSVVAKNGPEGGAIYLSRHIFSNQVLSAGYPIGTITAGTIDGIAAKIAVQSDAAGSATSLAGRLIFSTTANAAVSPTERMRIDSSGRVGIGTTAPAHKLTVSTGVDTDAGDITIGLGSVTAGATRQATITKNTTSPFEFTLASSNGGTNAATIFKISGSNEAARIDSSGRLLIGTSSTTRGGAGDITAQGSSVGAGLRLQTSLTSPADGDGLGYIYYADAGRIESATISAHRDGGTWTSGSSQPTRLVFSTTADGANSPTERMRLSSNGYLYHLGPDFAATFQTAAGAGTTYAIITGGHTATSIASVPNACFRVWSNGDVVNTNNSYTGISDIKLKENIVDASSQWDDLKALQVRNYNFKEGQTHTQIGLIAQEVELVSPGLVSESPDRDEDGNDLGTVTKSVNYSVLYMKAVKALQEAMERIEVLEQRLTDAGIA